MLFCNNPTYMLWQGGWPYSEKQPHAYDIYECRNPCSAPHTLHHSACVYSTVQNAQYMFVFSHLVHHIRSCDSCGIRFHPPEGRVLMENTVDVSTCQKSDKFRERSQVVRKPNQSIPGISIGMYILKVRNQKKLQ